MFIHDTPRGIVSVPIISMYIYMNPFIAYSNKFPNLNTHTLL